VDTEEAEVEGEEEVDSIPIVPVKMDQNPRNSPKILMFQLTFYSSKEVLLSIA
jgi:hypothetical protein